MFTGIVDHVGTITAIELQSSGCLLRIASPFDDLVLGESMAVDGVCLTVMRMDDRSFDCQLSPETLAHTVLSDYQVQQTVNLERAMRFNDRVGGHWVTGHVDTTIRLMDKQPHDAYWALSFSVPSGEHQPYCVTKGSIAIQGVSLTINTVDPSGFSVMLVPHTIERTTLSQLHPGMSVNVEWDYIAKIVAKQVNINEKQALHD